MTQDPPTITAAEMLAATGGRILRGDSRWSGRGISTDTRTLAAGNLFLALAGSNFDGHDHLAAAAARGAAGLMIRMDRWAELGLNAPPLPVIGVPDTLRALGDIAHAWRQRFLLPLVAITGSSGKTTSKEMLAAIAFPTDPILKTEGNLNNLIGLPQTLLGLREEHRLAIVEMGTNSPGEIARLAAIAAPTVGLITNIGPAHLEGLGSLEGVREEKGALWTVMDGKGTAILNRDDPQIAVLAGRWRGERVSFGFGAGADVTARQIGAATPDGVSFTLRSGGIHLRIRLRTPGRHNIANALAAAAAARALGYDNHRIAAGLAAFHPAPGRSEVRALANGAHLIMDTYNANPASVGEALKTLAGLRGGGRLFVVLGDMLELGDQADQWHARIGALLAETGIDQVYLKGDFARRTAEGAIAAGLPGERITLFDTPRTVLDHLGSRLKKEDWILVKGSRRMKMEAVAEAIIAAFDLKPQTV